jgi:NADH dehydrogenase
MRKQILIVGAGFAGMWAALSAARLADKHQQAIDITVIAPQPELRVRPRFYESAVQRWLRHCNRCLTLPASLPARHVEQILPASKR